MDFDLPEDVELYAGFVFHSAPHRHKPGKFYVSLEEYPFHLWPPYVTAGAYVLSRAALIGIHGASFTISLTSFNRDYSFHADFYYGSYFVKRFRFDDVYMGILAKKLGIEPFHSEEFYFERKPMVAAVDYRYVVASHGFGNPRELEAVWNNQKMAGNA